MADVKKMATRDGYGKALVDLGKDHPDIVVLAQVDQSLSLIHI